MRYRVPYLISGGNSSNTDNSSRNRSKLLGTSLETKMANPDLQLQALSRMVRVKPDCRVLQQKRIDFRYRNGL